MALRNRFTVAAALLMLGACALVARQSVIASSQPDGVVLGLSTDLKKMQAAIDEADPDEAPQSQRLEDIRVQLRPFASVLAKAALADAVATRATGKNTKSAVTMQVLSSGSDKDRIEARLKTELTNVCEKGTKGYLQKGHSLSGMPLTFTDLKGQPGKLGAACLAACKKHATCRGFTYHVDGECFLKSRVIPGTAVYNCKSDCWYMGLKTPSSLSQDLSAVIGEAATESTEHAYIHLRSHMLLAKQYPGATTGHDKGYLPSGDSLVGMPLSFGEKYKGQRQALGSMCELHCKKEGACRGFTYQPSSGVCYLKSEVNAPQGVTCTGDDCWYFGALDRPVGSTLADGEEMGLKVSDVKVGTGKPIKKGDTAVMKYVGTLDNGKVFDSGKYVFKFGEGQVIEGDDMGLQGMRVGGERKLTIPPALGYGSQGYPGSIPGGATLHFTVTLLELNNDPLPNGGYKED
mmetsp:Transcript_194/g.625  ORF Transcript_194/g.625 Transcript_194/m.625 type:complete len:461 (+) Transcript_194:18-1400(+)|eukprot:CAMPEP_0114559574 /NCGR_PEP_ID=MMETSP0114-20121206/10992_1 /TAXON_ID=31324 /ORGANISM="Goniomonas sp, Strain m" /LENGTH=460 /DNA_ID=CAMNT_0001745049 /DNA_START=9 /DNA_END=1391 /DNA_ORIENTATION=-